MRKGKRLTVTTAQREALQKIAKQRTAGADAIERSGIIIAYERAGNKTTVAESVGSTWDKVNRWVHRWHEKAGELNELERLHQRGALTTAEYRARLHTLLKDAQRSGAPRTFSVSQQQQIIALASQKPEDAGVPVTHWSHSLLAKTAVEKGIVARISSSHIGNFLKWGSLATA
jgi:transposase